MKLKYYIILGVSIILYACTPKVTDSAMGDKASSTTASTSTPASSASSTDKETFRSTAPIPSAAPVINIGEAESFTLDNGLKVILVENHKVPKVSFQLRLINDPIREGDKVGKVGMTADILRRGTEDKSKAELDAAIDFLGASVSSGSSGIYARTLTKHKDKVLGLMSEVLLSPSFPQEELDKMKKQTLSGLESAKSDPNSMARNVRSVVNYGKGHPYGEIQTPDHVANIELADLKQVYGTYYVPTNAYLVVVGDINKAEAMKAANTYFGEWRGSMIKPTKRKGVKMPTQTDVSFANKEGAVQSVISISSPIDIKPGDADAIPASVMNAILGGGFSSRLMQNLREDKAYTYGARSSISTDPLIGTFNAGASVRTEVSDSSITQFMYEINRMRTEPVGEEELQSIKNYMTGGFARALESPQTIARFAYNIAKYDLPADYYQTYLQRLNSVSANDVMAMANKYLQPDKMNIVVVGNKDDVSESLKQFDADGEITYFDAFGNLMEVNALPANISGQQVVDDYIAAMGGMDVINGIKTLYVKFNSNAMGQDLVIESMQKDDNKYKMVIGNGTMTFQEQIFNGQVAAMSAMGQVQKLTEGPDFEEIKEGAVLVPQKNYRSQGVTLEIKGLENIDGNNAYKVVVTSPSGDKHTEYYDVQTGLYVRKIEGREGPQGVMTITTDFLDYEKHGDMMFPMTTKVVGMLPGGAAMEMIAIEVVPNKPMTDADFEVK